MSFLSSRAREEDWEGWVLTSTEADGSLSLEACKQVFHENLALRKENERLLAQLQDLRRQNEVLQRAAQEPPGGSSGDADALEPATKAKEEDWLVAGDEGYCRQAIVTLPEAHSGLNVVSVAMHPRRPEWVASGGVDKHIAVWDWQQSTTPSAGAAAAASTTPGRGEAASKARRDLPAPPLALAWHPHDDVLATSCMDGSLHLTGIQSIAQGLEPLASVAAHRKFVEAARWSPDGRFLATGSADGTVKLWEYRRSACRIEDEGQVAEQSSIQRGGGEPQEGEEDLGAESSILREVQTYYFREAVDALAFVPSPRGSAPGGQAECLVMAPRGHPALKYVDLGAPSTPWEVSLNASAWDTHVSFNVLHLEASPDGRYLLAATDKDRHIIYPVGQHIHARELFGHAADAYAKPRVCWDSSGGYVLSNSQNDSGVFVWCLASQRVVHRLEGHKGIIRDLSHHPSRRLLATASYDHTVKVWGGPF